MGAKKVKKVCLTLQDLPSLVKPASTRARVTTFVTTASILSADNASPLASGVERFTAAPVIRTVAPGADLHSGQMADEDHRIFSYFRNYENVQVSVRV